ncbi:hypothetical protein IFM89_038010 [Coptis chinensis]|uniref:Peptidase M28 domain-containing protein n=1 Tax=Coptis chinensis TaxID=261450 RepID=A0A835HSW3_9MAGN|nr:hypothetical protein IFM89_038010 [Coptis chinensis]
MRIGLIKLNTSDISAFKCLISLSILYGTISILVYSILHMNHITPLLIDAPLDQFSEARAIEHVRILAQQIDGRQEGRPGLKEAANYIKSQLEIIAMRAGSNIRIEIEESLVSGSFNMMFLRHSISLAYRNHTNILMRISSADSKETDPSLLVNGHFDGPLGSPGAGDCASCVASMLEVARLTIDSEWSPPRPIIFLFNGAEELFLLGSHGFMKTNKWNDTIGAFINIEASGTGSLDLVCQSGPGSWPSLVYAQSAVHPMAHSAAQDVFPVIPGDTDYRIFAEDSGDIPGLDIIFLLGGYFYHTSYDTVERILPGSMQARGDNLFSLIRAFANSSKLQNAHERSLVKLELHEIKDDRAVFFDYLSLFMIDGYYYFFQIFYPRSKALLFHSLPFVIFLLMPFYLRYPNIGVQSLFRTFSDVFKGMLFHIIGVILGIIIPIIFSILRLLFSSYTMSWFAHPYLAFLMFVPSSLLGLLIPRTVWSHFPLSQDATVLKIPKEVLCDEARFWGAFGLYALITLVYLVAGLSGGFLTFVVVVFMLPAKICFCLLNKSFGHQSLKSTVGYVLPLIPSLAFSAYFGGFLVQFLIEKMGMMGSLPQPYEMSHYVGVECGPTSWTELVQEAQCMAIGYFVPDIVVAAVVGLVVGFCVGPLLPVVSHWLARSSILQFLLHLCVLALALSSQFFPYHTDAPKRLVLQHTFVTSDAVQILDSSFDLSVVDSNSLRFVFKHAPEVAKELQIGSELSLENIKHSHQGTWMVLFPVSFLFSGSLKFPSKGDDMLRHYSYFPLLFSYKPHTVSSSGLRKVYLELSLGSLEEVWVTVLNITGPLSNWSFADNHLPAPETVKGGPPSHICRLSGSSHQNWKFWLEVNSSEAIRVDVAVLDQYLADDLRKLKSLFPKMG